MLTQTPSCRLTVAVDKCSAGKPWHTPARPNAVSERLGERQAQGDTHAEKARAAEHAAKGSIVKPSRFPHPDDGGTRVAEVPAPWNNNLRPPAKRVALALATPSLGLGRSPVACLRACLLARLPAAAFALVARWRQPEGQPTWLRVAWPGPATWLSEPQSRAAMGRRATKAFQGKTRHNHSRQASKTEDDANRGKPDHGGRPKGPASIPPSNEQGHAPASSPAPTD